MKKILAMVLACCMIFALCAVTASADDTEPVTLHLWGGVPSEYGYDELCENFNKEFESKGLRIEYTRYVNNDDGNLQLDTYLMGGDEVDIYMGYGGMTRLTSRQEAGIALDMTPYLEARGFDPVEELGASNVSNFLIDGKYYAVPTKYENTCWMVVNADMFEEAGIELPMNGWTYSEFAEIAQKLTKGEGQDKIYGMYWNLPDFYNATVHMGAVLENARWYANDECTETSFDNEAWVKAVQLYIDSFEDGWSVSYEEQVADNLTFADTFLAGKAAMSAGIYNIRIINDLETYPHDFETALVPFPVPDESYMDNWNYNTYPGAGDLICVNPKSEHIEEAMDFVIWYIEGGMAPLAKSGRIPLWKGFDVQSIVDTLTAKPGVFNAESVRNYMSIDGTNVYQNRSTSNDSKIKTILKEELEAAFYGMQTAEETCANVKTRAEELLK